MGVPAEAGAEEESRAISHVFEKHHGDAWAAVRALLQHNEYLENELAAAWRLASTGYRRAGQPEPQTEH
jgi:hypothetical protein